MPAAATTRSASSRASSVSRSRSSPGGQAAWAALPTLIISLRYFQAMMSGRTTDSNPPARSPAATRSARSSVPLGKQPRSSRPGHGCCWPGSPRRARGGCSAASPPCPARALRVRCSASSLATPFCPLTSVTPGEVCRATSCITAAVWWLFTVTSTAVSPGLPARSRSAREAAARRGTTSSPCGVTRRSPCVRDRLEVRPAGDRPGRRRRRDGAGRRSRRRPPRRRTRRTSRGSL